MANFLEGVENLLKHPIDEIKWMADETKGVVKPLLKGDVSESWDSFKGSFGRHNKMMEDITVPLGGRNKITENPDAAAGAILGSIFAAPAIGSALGGGSSGGGFGGFGTEGAFGKYFQPEVTEVSAWNKFKGKLSSMTDFGNKDLGELYKDIDFDDPANDDLLGLISDVEGEIASGKKGFDYELLGRTLSSIKPKDAPKISHLGRGGGGGSFRYDKSLYENPLLTREFNALYSEPLYKKLT